MVMKCEQCGTECRGNKVADLIEQETEKLEAGKSDALETLELLSSIILGLENELERTRAVVRATQRTVASRVGFLEQENRQLKADVASISLQLTEARGIAASARHEDGS